MASDLLVAALLPLMDTPKTRPLPLRPQPGVYERVKADLILIFSTNTNQEIVAYRSFQFLEFEVRGVRKVTTGITGLWQPSVHSDVAF